MNYARYKSYDRVGEVVLIDRKTNEELVTLSFFLGSFGLKKNAFYSANLVKQ